tara:strand:+ start:8764 stop:9474 length:711 start_codon:yes stop_codon:yes gene_type:complete
MSIKINVSNSPDDIVLMDKAEIRSMIADALAEQISDRLANQVGEEVQSYLGGTLSDMVTEAVNDQDMSEYVRQDEMPGIDELITQDNIEDHMPDTDDFVTIHTIDEHLPDMGEYVKDSDYNFDDFVCEDDLPNMNDYLENDEYPFADFVTVDTMQDALSEFVRKDMSDAFTATTNDSDKARIPAMIVLQLQRMWQHDIRIAFGNHLNAEHEEMTPEQRSLLNAVMDAIPAPQTNNG